MRQLPSNVKVAGLNYKVIETDFIEIEHDRNYQGSCNINQSTIEVLKELVWERKKRVFIHELLHAVMFEAGLREHDEELINRLVPVLTQVMENNDFSWMRE